LAHLARRHQQTWYLYSCRDLVDAGRNAAIERIFENTAKEVEQVIKSEGIRMSMAAHRQARA